MEGFDLILDATVPFDMTPPEIILCSLLLVFCIVCVLSRLFCDSLKHVQFWRAFERKLGSLFDEQVLAQLKRSFYPCSENVFNLCRGFLKRAGSLTEMFYDSCGSDSISHINQGWTSLLNVILLCYGLCVAAGTLTVLFSCGQGTLSFHWTQIRTLISLSHVW